jgi:hypothetical protein
MAVSSSRADWHNESRPLKKENSMKSDLYTKLVLTVIAVSLSVIAVQITTKAAYAQAQGLLFSPSGALMVSICDPVGPLGQRRGGWTCADVLNEGVTVAIKK